MASKTIHNRGKNTLRFEYRDKAGKMCDVFWGIEGDERIGKGGIVEGPANVQTLDDEAYKALIAQPPFAELVDNLTLVVR
jgi:hypothetical protein